MMFRLLRHLVFVKQKFEDHLRSKYYNQFIHLYHGQVGKNLWVRQNGKIHITKGGKLEIGNNFILGEGADLFIGKEGHLRIGDNVFIGKNSTVVANGSLAIDNGTQIAHLVTIIDSNHRFSDPKAPLSHQGAEVGKISIGKEVWIGANAVILKNVRIGDHAVVGAGSVVTKDIAPKSVVVGIPANPLKS